MLPPSIDVLSVAILAVASWRISTFLQWERGPFSVACRLRQLVGVEHNEDGEPISWPDTEIGRLLACTRCTSVWVAICMVFVYLWWPSETMIVALALTLSALVIIISEIVDG